MMTDNERDTHFQGFANLLDEEIESALENIAEFNFVPDAISDDIKRIIAQRAYDLAVHVLEYAQDDAYYNPHSLIAQNHVPDLTEWPEYRLDRNDND